MLAMIGLVLLAFGVLVWNAYRAARARERERGEGFRPAGKLRWSRDDLA